MSKKKKQQKMTSGTQEFAKFLSSLQLVSINQLEGSFKANITAPEANTSVSITTEAEWEKKDNGFNGILKANITIVKSDQNLGELSGVFRLAYIWDCEYEIYPEEFVTTFLESNIHFNAWPFLREYVHSCFQRMGWPPLAIPLLKQRVVMVK